MDFTAVTAANRPQVNRFIRERWFSTDMILRGAIVDMTKADGILTLDDGQIFGGKHAAGVLRASAEPSAAGFPLQGAVGSDCRSNKRAGGSIANGGRIKRKKKAFLKGIKPSANTLFLRILLRRTATSLFECCEV